MIRSSPARSAASASGRLAPALCAALVAAIYLPALGIGYCSDDFFLLNWGRCAASGWELLRPGTDWYYRPLVLLTYRWEALLLDRPAALAHGVNLALHLLACSLVWTRWRRLGTAAAPAAMAVCWFGLHPLGVETVAWVAGRTDLLAALGVLAAAELIARNRGGGVVLPCAAAAATGLGLLAKESAVVAPLLILTDLLARSPRPPLVATLKNWVPSALLVAVYWIAAGPRSSTQVHPPLDALANLAVCFTAIFMPWPQNPLGWLAARPDDLILRAVFLGAGLALAVLLWLGLRRGEPRLRSAILWGLIALIPAALYQGLQARYLYLPAAGAAGLAALAVEQLSRSSRRLAGVLAGLVILLAASTVTWQLWAWREAGQLCRELPRMTRRHYPRELPEDPATNPVPIVIGAPDHVAALYPYAPAYAFREGAWEALLFEYRDRYPPGPRLSTRRGAAQSSGAAPVWRYDQSSGALRRTAQ
jgi:hypothetical protein